MEGKLIIKSGFFYGAGSSKVYNWEKDGYHIFGVGINEKLVNSYDIIRITVEGEQYFVKTDEVKEFAKKYRSYKVRKRTRLLVVSKSLLNLI